MNISLIPKDEIPKGYKSIIMSPPDGDLTNDHIRACEMIMATTPQGILYRARFVLDDGDFKSLKEGQPIWLSMWNAVVPFDVDIGNLE